MSEKHFGTSLNDPTGLFQGRRLAERPAVPAPGDYWRDSAATWWACPPRGGVIELAASGMIERLSDGTLTTSHINLPLWSGSLREGVWISDILGAELPA